MQKIIKKLVLGIMTLLFLFGLTPNIFAASGYAFTVGTDYGTGDANSIPTAQLANDYFLQMGYTRKLLTLPTYYDMISSISSTRKWIQSDALFFIGHTINTGITMIWNYHWGSDANYMTGVKTGNPGSCGASPYNSYICAGLGYYSLSNTELAVMQGCYSGTNSSGLANYAVGRGAKSAIGWTDTVPANSTFAWTNNFMQRLKNGATVGAARTYANSQNYNDANIKKAVLKGTSGTTINSMSTLSKSAVNIDSNTYTINEKFNIKELDENEKMNLIADEIKTRVNKSFNIDDYIAEMVALTDDETYYDFNFKIGGIKTNVGYVVTVNEKDNLLVSITDNMGEYNASSLKTNKEGTVRSKLNTLSETKIANMRIKAMEQKNISKIFDRKLGKEYMYYDVKQNKLYYIIDVEETFNGEISAILDYWTEIK